MKRLISSGAADKELNVNLLSAGNVFIRRNLTSVDVKFWSIKTIPALKEIKYF